MAWRIIRSDCVEAMRGMEAESIDAIVTDPPYGLEFMGKEWDSFGGAHDHGARGGDGDRGILPGYGRGGTSEDRFAFRQKSARAFQEFADRWAREALRVLKPGGHLLAFGGTRTYHRMACAIEDAGFEIRDSLHWLYGSGFPKSLDVSKAIKDATHRASAWNGWGTAIKPAHEPIVLARKPIDGTVAACVLAHGTGGINIDGCRIGTTGGGTHCTNRGPDGRCLGHANAGKSTSGETFHGPDTSGGRWPPNLLLTHDPECGDECVPGCPIAELDRQCKEGGMHSAGSAREEPGGGTYNGTTGIGMGIGIGHRGFRVGDSGGASRFFPVFRYVAKPARAERDAGLWDIEAVSGNDVTGRADGSAGAKCSARAGTTSAARRNIHPTVKPVALMEWLVQLVTPPGGTVLDCFLGSGTTGCAAVRLGFSFVGIEREAEYVAIAERRIALAANAPRTKGIGELERGSDALPGQIDLFPSEPR